jgi:hypothetical protein
MSRVRFATAQALFETFPDLHQRIDAKPTDQRPIEFLRGVVTSGKLNDAVAFCAYLLPRREAVWWACGCTRSFLGDIPRDRAAGLVAAEAWVYEPDEDHRRAVLEIGMAGEGNNPSTWIALAAGWSSGSLFTYAPAPVQPYMTARCTRNAVLLAAMSLKNDERPARLRASIEEAIKLAETGL